MVKRKLEGVPCSICLDDETLGQCPHDKPICGDCMGNWLNLSETTLINENELSCYCKGGPVNLDILYQILLEKSVESIEKIKSISKLQSRYAEKAVIKKAPVEEDEFRFFIRQFAIDIQGLVVSCPRCKRPFDGWTACMAIQCDCDDGVKANICGWCLKWSNADTHAHAGTCKAVSIKAGIFISEVQKGPLMKKHLSDLIVSKLLALPHHHILYAFNCLVDYLDKAEITGQVRATLEQNGFVPLLLHLVTWGGDGVYTQYEDPEIRSLTSIALYLRTPTLLWFEDRRTTPPTLTHAIYQPHLCSDTQGFQMTVERVPTTYVMQNCWVGGGAHPPAVPVPSPAKPAAGRGRGRGKAVFAAIGAAPSLPGTVAVVAAAASGKPGDRLVVLVDSEDRSLDTPSELRPLAFSAEDTAKCLGLLEAGIPYVHAYHADGRPVAPAEREYEAHADAAAASFLVVYPNRRVWALRPLLTATGEVRIRPTGQDRRASSHFNTPPFAF